MDVKMTVASVIYKTNRVVHKEFDIFISPIHWDCESLFYGTLNAIHLFSSPGMENKCI